MDNNTLDEYEEKYNSIAIDANTFLTTMKQYVPEVEEKPPEAVEEEKPTAEEMETEKPPEGVEEVETTEIMESTEGELAKSLAKRVTNELV